MEFIKRFTIGNVISVNKYHFLLVQILNVIFGIITTTIIYQFSPVGIYLFIFFPVILGLILFEYLLFWKRISSQFSYIKIHIGILVLFGTVFFILCNKVQLNDSFPFEQIESCKIEGQMNEKIGEIQDFSTIIIDFSFQGKQYQGYACFLNNQNGIQFKKKVKPKYFDSEFYPKKCENQTAWENQQEIDVFQQASLLNQTVNFSQNYHRDCKQEDPLTFVNIEEWMCLSDYNSFEELTQPKVCYFGIINPLKLDEDLSAYLKDDAYPQKNFALVLFGVSDEYISYDIIVLVILYYPFIISFNGFFYYVSKKILLKFMQKYQDDVEFKTQMKQDLQTIGNVNQISILQKKFFSENVVEKYKQLPQPKFNQHQNGFIEQNRDRNLENSERMANSIIDLCEFKLPENFQQINEDKDSL